MAKTGPKRTFNPDKKELNNLYQQMSMAKIANHYGVGESVVSKRIREYGITLDGFSDGHRSKPKVFTEEHRENISKSLTGNLGGSKNPNWKGGNVEKICEWCGEDYKVIPARLETARFCSYKCRGEWRKVNYHGLNNPRYRSDVVRTKVCQGCGNEFSHKKGSPLVNFMKQKFCSKDCADKHGLRYTGEDHLNYKADSRRRVREGKHGSWARAVLSRDQATCQHCGAKEIELHAHHIKSYKDFPELRWELGNGLTLCFRCHWDLHTALNAKEVNLGNTQPSNVGGNPEPGNERKFVEGVRRGRAYRRWEGHCEWCEKFITKRWSDTKGKKHLFCSQSCSGKYIAAHRTYRRWKNPPKQ